MRGEAMKIENRTIWYVSRAEIEDILIKHFVDGSRLGALVGWASSADGDCTISQVDDKQELVNWRAAERK